MTAAAVHHRRPILGSQLGRVIERWKSLPASVRQTILDLVDNPTPPTEASIAPPVAIPAAPVTPLARPAGVSLDIPRHVPPEARPVSPEAQALFDLLTPDEVLLFGERWFYSGHPSERFIQGRPGGPETPVFRFDGRILQKRDAADA